MNKIIAEFFERDAEDAAKVLGVSVDAFYLYRHRYKNGGVSESLKRRILEALGYQVTLVIL